MTLFNLCLTPLFIAIATVESDRGATSSNVYQIRDIYIHDLNRIYMPFYKLSDKYSIQKSEQMMFDYWRHYAYKWHKETGKPITYEVLARIHNGGPNGMRKRSTYNYWLRVKKILIKKGWFQ